MTPHTTLLLIALCVSFAAGVWLSWWAWRWYGAGRVRRRFRRGARGEQDARRYLEKKGFTITGSQQYCRTEMMVDGRRVPFSVVADYLVTRNGRRGVVEVKTGTRAGNPASRETRRQLFEYASLFAPDDLYLFDADTGRLLTIQFNQALSGSAHGVGHRVRFGWCALGLGVAFALGVGVGVLLV